MISRLVAAMNQLGTPWGLLVPLPQLPSPTTFERAYFDLLLDNDLFVGKYWRAINEMYVFEDWG